MVQPSQHVALGQGVPGSSPSRSPACSPSGTSSMPIGDLHPTPPRVGYHGSARPARVWGVTHLRDKSIATRGMESRVQPAPRGPRESPVEQGCTRLPWLVCASEYVLFARALLVSDLLRVRQPHAILCAISCRPPNQAWSNDARFQISSGVVRRNSRGPSMVVCLCHRADACHGFVHRSNTSPSIVTCPRAFGH